MNLTITKCQQRNYINNNLKNNKSKKFSLDSYDKKISEEEDKLDYELYKKSHMLHSAFSSVEEAQRHKISFPPATAPGIVRKAWREMWENGTEEQKEAMRSFDNIYLTFLTENNGEMPNDLNGYFKFLDKIKTYVEPYNHCPNVDQDIYDGIMDILDVFEDKLGKYKNF